MAIQKTEAIVLTTHNFRETSLIINFFTKDFGKIKGLIKGVRSQPQRYGGIPLAFSRSFIVFYEKPARDLHLVTQCDWADQFQGIRSDWQRANYAHYFVELLDAVTFDNDKNAPLFELMVNALCALGTNLEPWRIARIFEIKLLNLSGFKPRIDACVSCQKEIVPPALLKSNTNLHKQARFSSLLGGILCPRCFKFDQGAQKVFPGTLSSIDYIEQSNWQKAFNLNLAHRLAQELAAILNGFLTVHLDKEIKSQKFLI